MFLIIGDVCQFIVHYIILKDPSNYSVDNLLQTSQCLNVNEALILFLYQVLAKNNELTDNSYDFLVPHTCRIPDCTATFSTAMDMFRHVRENHLTPVKKLKIKIGTPPPMFKRSGRPGPRSKTMIRLSANHFPFPASYLSVASPKPTPTPCTTGRILYHVEFI